jgi:hypothetical protein
MHGDDLQAGSTWQQNQTSALQKGMRFNRTLVKMKEEPDLVKKGGRRTDLVKKQRRTDSVKKQSERRKYFSKKKKGKPNIFSKKTN